MGIDDIQISHEIDGKYVTFQLESEKAALLIGKRGQTLNALQQLSQLVTNKSANQFKVVRVDVGDYRERREQSLEQLADRMADKAVRTGRKIQLNQCLPMKEKSFIMLYQIDWILKRIQKEQIHSGILSLNPLGNKKSRKDETLSLRDFFVLYCKDDLNLSTLFKLSTLGG